MRLIIDLLMAFSIIIVVGDGGGTVGVAVAVIYHPSRYIGKERDVALW